MKAILVIDMPQNCGVCPISEYILFENGKARTDVGGNCPIENNYIEKWNERPSWCPLKPIPQKKNEEQYQDFENGTSIYWTTEVINKNKGYNACLDEIVRKENEE